MNKKRVGKVAVVVGLVMVLLHFVPVQRNLGYLVLPTGVRSQVITETCEGHFGPVPHYYRLVLAGWSDYNYDKKLLVKDSRAANGDQGADPAKYPACSDPVDLRLYLF